MSGQYQVHVGSETRTSLGVYDFVSLFHSNPLMGTDFSNSYGRIGGVHCSENPMLIQGILRQEWKFDGIVMSDW
jgi:beta-glucosidase-like glycosyl hydrolase